MSYNLNGRTYHDPGEYQRAKQADQRRQAQREASQLSSRMKSLERENRDLSRVADELQSDVAAVERSQQQIRSNVEEIRRVQQQLASAQQAMEQRMEHEFDQVRHEVQQGFDQVHCEIETTRQDLAELERDHQAHVAEVQWTFTEVRDEIDVGLAEAEQRRQETEQRLQGEIDRVEQMVEEDRQERLRRQTSESDRAGEQIRLVEATLARHADRYGALNLEEEAQSIREQIAQANQLHARGDSASALAAGHAAFGQARSLTYRVHKRQAELEEGRRQVEERAARLRQTMAADAEIERYFSKEMRLGHAVLERAENTARRGYVDYRRLAIESERDERILERMDRQILTMVASVPAIKSLAEERKGRAGELVRQLKHLYGPLSHANQRFADQEDRKSKLILECNFGGAHVDLLMDLDGTYSIDGYGHGSNTECSQRGTAVVGALAQQNIVNESHVDTYNRTEPTPSAEATRSRWQDVETELHEIERAQR